MVGSTDHSSCVDSYTDTKTHAYIYDRTKIVPCAVASGLDIGLSNSSLKTITLAFYSKAPHISPLSDRPASNTKQRIQVTNICVLVRPFSHVQVVIVGVCAVVCVLVQAGEAYLDFGRSHWRDLCWSVHDGHV